MDKSLLKRVFRNQRFHLRDLDTHDHEAQKELEENLQVASTENNVKFFLYGSLLASCAKKRDGHGPVFLEKLPKRIR